MTIPVPPEPTPAYRAFRGNLFNLASFAEIVVHGTTGELITEEVARGMPPRPTQVIPVPAGIDFVHQATTASVLSGIDAAREVLTEGMVRMAAAQVAQQWLVAMHVTITETYLQDVLTYVELQHPLRILESKATLEWSDIGHATSVEELRAELCRRWARNLVGDGGPTKWQKKLENLGAKFSKADVGDTLEPMWGIRHVVVHNAGVVTQEFVRRHAGLGTVGKPIQVPRAYADWAAAIDDLALGTERYVQGRLAAQSGLAS